MRLHVTLLSIAAGLLAAAAPAAAQTARPLPCAGEHLDPRGDQRVGFAGTNSPLAAEPNLDITTLFLVNDGKKVTLNLGIADLTSTDGPPGSLGLVYRLFYTPTDGVRRYVDVTYSAVFGESYSYGTANPSLTYVGETTGRAFRGKDGLISVTLPRDAGGVPGTALSNVSWRATSDRGAVIAQADIAPDSGGLALPGWACPEEPADPASAG